MQLIIWSHTASPPQTIGASDGLEALGDLLQRARRSGHGLRHAVRLEDGARVSLHLFDTAERLEAYLARNSGLHVADRADIGPLLERELAQLQRDRQVRRGAAPMPAGSLFDEVTRDQRSLF